MPPTPLFGPIFCPFLAPHRLGSRGARDDGLHQDQARDKGQAAIASRRARARARGCRGQRGRELVGCGASVEGTDAARDQDDL